MKRRCSQPEFGPVRGAPQPLAARRAVTQAFDRPRGLERLALQGASEVIARGLDEARGRDCQDCARSPWCRDSAVKEGGVNAASESVALCGQAGSRGRAMGRAVGYQKESARTLTTYLTAYHSDLCRLSETKRRSSEPEVHCRRPSSTELSVVRFSPVSTKNSPPLHLRWAIRGAFSCL